MGGCCCSLGRAELNREELGYQHFPCSPAGHDPPSSTQHRFSAVSVDALVDPNLETSNTEISQAPRPPSVPLGRTSNSPLDSQPVENAIDRSSDDLKGPEVKTRGESLAESPKSCEEKKSKLDEPDLFKDEEDVCPTCLEEYDKENPKIITNCGHEFHLSCILEWMERSDTCAVCNQAMIFNEQGNL